jgi:hypothetical protein
MARVALADKVVRLRRALARARIPHAFGGALALAYYATPRATVDIDLNVFVSTDRYEAVAAVLSRAGAETIPAAAVAVRDGQVRAWWGETPIDVFFAYDEVHDAMRRGVRSVPFGRTTIPILAPEHLIVAKAAFDRPKDWLDIEQMLVALDDVDVVEIRNWFERLVGRKDQRAARFASLAAELRGVE